MLLSINNNIENVMNEQDFSYVIEKYMGDEAKKYYEEVLYNHSSEINFLNSEINELNLQIGDID